MFWLCACVESSAHRCCVSAWVSNVVAYCWYSHVFPLSALETCKMQNLVRSMFVFGLLTCMVQSSVIVFTAGPYHEGIHY